MISAVFGKVGGCCVLRQQLRIGVEWIWSVIVVGRRKLPCTVLVVVVVLVVVLFDCGWIDLRQRMFRWLRGETP